MSVTNAVWGLCPRPCKHGLPRDIFGQKKMRAFGKGGRA